ncbi:TPA: hypothetical protein I8F30_004382, partial [Salmonella enterica]|nr:hypothetical protein [Salmonella enterica]
MEQESEILKFETYKAMSRVPNFAGVPVFALLFLSIGGVISTFVSAYFWGWWGLLVALPFV